MRGQVQRIDVKRIGVKGDCDALGACRAFLSRRSSWVPDTPPHRRIIHTRGTYTAIAIEFTRNNNTDLPIPYAVKRVGARYVDVYGDMRSNSQDVLRFYSRSPAYLNLSGFQPFFFTRMPLCRPAKLVTSSQLFTGDATQILAHRPTRAASR